MPAPNPNLAAALDMAANGWPVFPCSPNTKQPLVKSGFKVATCDEAQIAEWWGKWPNAIIGVPTGAREQNGIGCFVIDVDIKNDEGPTEAIAYLEQKFGVKLDTRLRVITPRGGRHLYFQHADGLELRNRNPFIKTARGSIIDVRANGGYVIVPPSMRAGGQAAAEGCDGIRYEWASGNFKTAPPAAPEALLKVLPKPEYEEPRKAGAAKDAVSSIAKIDEAVAKFAATAQVREFDRLRQAGEGTRNTTINEVAFNLGQLVGAGALSQAGVEEGLRAIVDDWPNRKKSYGTIKSGLRAGIAQPRDLSEVGMKSRQARPGGTRGVSSVAPAAPWEEFEDEPRGAMAEAPSEGAGDEPQTEQGGNGGKAVDDERRLKILGECAGLDDNDTGNGFRLIKHFGGEFLFVRNIGPHVWTGSHWEREGGDEALTRLAQKAAVQIRYEVDHLMVHPEELEAIDYAAKYSASDIERLRKERAAARDLKRKDYDSHNKSGLETIEKGEAAEEELRKIENGLEAEARLKARRKSKRKFSISSGNGARINSMMAAAEVHKTLAPEDMDKAPLSINVLNGTLHIKSDTRKVVDLECPDPDETRYIEETRWLAELKPHNRRDLITKCMQTEYQKEAGCPKWDAFLERFQPEEPVRRFLRQWFGYALTGLMREQQFPFFYGRGANGKTTFIEALSRMMGSYASVLPAETLTGDAQRRGDQATPEFARLPGVRFVRAAELPRGQGFRESTLKMLTGGEIMLVRHLHERFFEFEPIFKAVGSGNDRPNIGGVDEGIWRRMKLVKWNVSIPLAERRGMPEVLAEFAAEYPGILNWALAGLFDYLENGLVIPEEITAATDAYRKDMDPVGEFTDACVIDAEGEHTQARPMYEAYTAWCHANSVKPFAEKTFATIMVQKGFEKVNGRIRTYQNVVLQDVPEDPTKAKPHDGFGPGWDD